METTTLQTTRQNLPPTEIDCKWRKQGHCFRGNKRLFRHNPALEGIDRSRAEKSRRFWVCNCGHVFCLGIWFSVQHCGCFARSYIYEIITIILRMYSRLERFHQALPSPNDNPQKASRTCPLCRAHSNFVVPSVFLPLPFQRLKLHLDHTLTRERLEVNRSNCLVGTRANRSKRS